MVKKVLRHQDLKDSKGRAALRPSADAVAEGGVKMTGPGKQRWSTLLVLTGLGWLGYQALQRWRQEDIRGQVVLITGSSRGLGLAMAREFARAGCRLVLCARDAEELERARHDLVQRGAEVLIVPCDVADREQVRHLVGQATERFGQV